MPEWALEYHKIWKKASWFRGFYSFVTQGQVSFPSMAFTKNIIKCFCMLRFYKCRTEKKV